MNSISRFSAALLSAFLLTAPTAMAQTELPQSTGFAGLLLGLAKPNEVDGRLGYGATIGLNFANRISGYGYFLNSSSDDAGIESMVSHYGLGADYGFGGAVEGLRAGARIGAATASIDTPAGDDSDTVFSLGPVIGYDYPIHEMFSIGAETSWMFDFADNETTNTVYVLATARYRF